MDENDEKRGHAPHTQRPDPYAHYAKMREEAPVYFNAALRVWEVYGYRDIQKVLGDPITFSSAVSTRSNLAFMDPPRHTQLRRRLARVLTNRRIADMEPAVQTITEGLLDRVAASGRIDVVRDFASLLPLYVIAELLALPIADRDWFTQRSVPVIRAAERDMRGLEPDPTQEESLRPLDSYLQAVIVERGEHPGTDVISELLVGEGDPRPTLQEVTGLCRLLLIAGAETTATMIGNAVHLLLTHPGELARVRADPGLASSVVEETLRYRTPFQFFARKATRDVTLGGCLIRAGEHVLTFDASGNHDEALFVDATRFDVTRTPNHHLSFGYGVHYCLGAPLGRLEGRVGISRLLRRFPDLHLDEEESPEPLLSGLLFGWRSLPARFTPSAL